ncbi:hypothetical protein PITC_062290 [Penicillium italicum]|uniref:Transcription factor, fungi n=1 Tax=Penicillium italicum TaxID=40296 RepID=A0A0A2L8R4_PENIT|nr:hypothetical protein PITC_062290 [Penicillium italicum]
MSREGGYGRLRSGRRPDVRPRSRPVQPVRALIKHAAMLQGREARGDHKLAYLEEKVKSILSGSTPGQSTGREHAEIGVHGSSQPFFRSSTGPTPNELKGTVNVPSLCCSSSSVISHGIDLYFQYCHRQPIWCFDREEALNTCSLSEELMETYISAVSTLGLLYSFAATVTERRKRLFWSLQSLDQTYGQQNGPLCISAEAFRYFYVSNSNEGAMQKEVRANPPPLPTEDIGCSNSSDIGIWSLAIHFGWVWSKARSYVSDCAENKLEEPWKYNSMYARVLSDLTEIENRLSQCHRYDSVKFYERTAEELRTGREYWAPWLNLQFTYHATLTVLNHPFLYIVASQYNKSLTIPNAFWRRSSELVLLHATWIVRMIDMVSDKDMGLTDPFFGHAAAIAATKTLDKMTRIASVSENGDYDLEYGRFHLSIPLMWKALQFNTKPKPCETPTSGLLYHSLAPAVSTEDVDDSSASTLDVIVAISPDITVNTADGGTATHMP